MLRGKSSASGDRRRSPLRSKRSRFAPKDDGEAVIKALTDSVNDASRHFRAVAIPYLLVMVYIFVALGSITSRDILFNTPTGLPLLNVEVSLVGFFIAAPLLFFLLHLNILLQTHFLARRAQALDEALRKNSDGDTREDAQWRNAVFPLVVSQLLLGSHHTRAVRALLLVATALSLLLLPLILFFAVQFSSMRSHDSVLTWLHRGLIIADLLAIAFLCPPLMRG